jgi:hypothetical protein
MAIWAVLVRWLRRLRNTNLPKLRLRERHAIKAGTARSWGWALSIDLPSRERGRLGRSVVALWFGALVFAVAVLLPAATRAQQYFNGTQTTPNDDQLDRCRRDGEPRL